jgi:DNA-binding winged helix-turn-helix (wHTH) protein
MLIRFGDCELDSDRRELHRGTELVHVQPQVFDLLVHLIAHHDRVISKDQMVEAVWKGRFVSDVTLNSRVNAARQAIGDDGKRQAFIRTVPRRGFRFVGELIDETAGPGVAIETSNGTRLPETKTRSIAASQDVRFCRSSDGVNLAIATCGMDFPWSRPGPGSRMSSMIGIVRFGRRCFSNWQTAFVSCVMIREAAASPTETPR